MVQTRSMKIQEENTKKEKMAIHTLLRLSREESENALIGDSEFTQEQINDKRFNLTREYCKNELMKIDKPMHDLVKYCPYNGSFEQQIQQSITNNNMDVYYALKSYKNQMEEYDKMNHYLKDNFNNIMNNFNDQFIIDKLKNEKNIAFLKKKKEEVEFLREIKLIKETIKTKKEIKSIIDDDIKYHEQNYDRKMKEYTLKFS